MLILSSRIWILLILWSYCICPILCDGEAALNKRNQTMRISRKPYHYVSTLSNLQLPDVHVTFPAFNTQVNDSKREIDLSSNSIIRYTPVYEKQALPTASNQHFEKILNKIKSFKRKLKNHRRLTTPLYSPVSAVPLSITPIAVPAYDYFPVGPDYLHQYLQISHKYDMQSCIYLKISEDSFMKIQCYPILPHTDQVETYPTSYNNELANPDVANVYHTLVPNAPQTYPQESFYDLQLLGTTAEPYGTFPYSNAYYFQDNSNQHSTKTGYTPHPLPAHSAPSPPTLSSSFAPSIKYSKPNKVFHFNKTSLPLPVSFPSSNGLNANFTDKKLTTLVNTYEHQSNRFPVDNKSEMTDNDSPTKISLLNHIIVPLDIDTTEKLDWNKLFSRPDDTVVVEVSTEKFLPSSTTTDSTLIVNELYVLPGLGITHPVDKTEFTQVFAYPTKRTTFHLPESDHLPSAVSETHDFAQYNKGFYETTERVTKTTIGQNIDDTSERTEQPVEATNIPIKVSVEDRKYELVEIDVTTATGFDLTTSGTEQYSITTTDIEDGITSESDLRLLTLTVPGTHDTDFTTSIEDLSSRTTTYQKNIPISSVESFSTTTVDIAPYHKGTSTADSFVTNTVDSLPDDVRELPTSTVVSFVTTTVDSAPNDVKQLPTSNVDSFVTTTDSSLPNSLRNLPTSTVESFVTSSLNISPDYLRKLPISTLQSFIDSTVDNSLEDVRELPTSTVQSFVTTTVDNSSDDVRQLPISTVETFVTSTVDTSPYDVKELSTSTVENFVTTTIDSVPDDVRQLPISTDESFVISTVDNSTDDARKLPISTVESFEPFAFDNSPDDVSQLLKTFTENLVTTTVDSSPSLPDDMKQLATIVVESFITTTTDSPTDDMRLLPIGTDESDVTTTDDISIDDLEQSSISNTEDNLIAIKSSDDPRHLETTTIESFKKRISESSSDGIEKSQKTTLENTSFGPRQLSTRANDVPPDNIANVVLYVTDNPYESDLKQLLVRTTDASNNADLSPSTTDDSMTWFTSDLEDFSKITRPLALVDGSEDADDFSTTQTLNSIVNTEETPSKYTGIMYTTSQTIEQLTEKSIEDNEIIPHQIFTENINENLKSLQNNKLSTTIDFMKFDGKNVSLNVNKTFVQDKVKLDKNSILSLSSENLNQGYGRKIPLETDEGNIVKVLEKNINTGKWEVQFYKVTTNNTNLNSEDIDLPRRSDVLISDYDGYDNIDSDTEIQYEYDYREKNTSEQIGKLSITSNLKPLLNDEVKKSTTNVNKYERKKRQNTYNIKELEQLNSSYEKLKENNSSVLSDIRDLTQNNTQNRNNTNLNVNYLDDFIKLTYKIKQYYDDKKEIKRTKRNIVISPPEERQEFLELKTDDEKSTKSVLWSDRNKRQISPFIMYKMWYGPSMPRNQRKRRYKRNIDMTGVTENSASTHNNGMSENIKNNTTVKQFLLPEVLLQDSNSKPSHSHLKSIYVERNTNDTLGNFSNVPSSKNSKYLNIQKTPNYTKQNEEGKFKTFNGSLFDLEQKIETTTKLLVPVVNTGVNESNTNKVYIYKHKNSSNVDHIDFSATANPKVISKNSSQEPQRTIPHIGYDGSSKVDQLKTNQILQDKLKTKNATSSKGNYLIYFQKLKNALKNNSFSSKNNNYSTVSKIEEYNGTQLNFTSKNLPTNMSQLVNNIPFEKTLITSINLMKNITALLKKQNTSSNGSSIDGTNDPVVKDKELIPTDKTFELKFKIGKVINTTASDVVYVPMYVEMLLMTQIILLLVLLGFFVFLHYADTRLTKRRQFDSSVTYLNNGFDSNRIFNNLP